MNAKFDPLLPLEALAEEFELEVYGVSPVFVGVRARARNVFVRNFHVEHFFVESLVDIIEKVGRSAVDDYRGHIFRVEPVELVYHCMAVPSGTSNRKT